ncbi:MAG: sensor histidine kinase [bacterium]
MRPPPATGATASAPREALEPESSARAIPYRYGVAAVISIPLLFGLLETTQISLRRLGGADPMRWDAALVMTLPRWLLLIPLAFAVVKLCARFPLGVRAWHRSVPLHLVASLVFTVAHLAACVVTYGFIIEGIPNQFAFRLRHLLTQYLAIDLLIYWAIVGSWSAFRFYSESRARELASSKLEAMLAQARLDALRAQIQPHFLFNTLNTVSVLAMKGDRATVARVLECLSELLRITIRQDVSPIAPLSRELAILDLYLEIQRVRFSDRLTVVQEIGEGTREASFPSLTLQPLVENAMQHGISASPGPGSVRIVARRDGENLRVEVHDSGPGFPSERGLEAGRGVGLENTRSRLEHLYARAHRFELGHSPDGGAFVAITIPFAIGSPAAAPIAAGLAPA